MNVKHFYKVAEHCFCLDLPDSTNLWNALTKQYAPFEISGNEAEGKLLFSMEYVKEMEEAELTCVYDEPTEDGETVVKLYTCPKGWVFESAIDRNHPVCTRVLADRDFSHCSIAIFSRQLKDAIFAINNAAMLMFAFASAGYHTLEMHASVIENNGKSYLFLGKSGTGKSTHSSLWLKHIPGSSLLNDDNPIVRIWPGKGVIAYGSPWSGKTPCYKNASAPVGAFVQIRQCPDNRIKLMGVLEGYSSLYSSVSGIKDDNSRMADDLNGSISDVLTAIPCWLLDCRPDEEAAQLCYKTVTK